MAQLRMFRQVGRAASLLLVLALSLWAQPLLRLSRRAAMRAGHPAGQMQTLVPVKQAFRGLAANWVNCRFHALVHPDWMNGTRVHPMRRARWTHLSCPSQGRWILPPGMFLD